MHSGEGTFLSMAEVAVSDNRYTLSAGGSLLPSFVRAMSQSSYSVWSTPTASFVSGHIGRVCAHAVNYGRSGDVLGHRGGGHQSGHEIPISLTDRERAVELHE